jgi:hypothetical protein
MGSEWVPTNSPLTNTRALLIATTYRNYLQIQKHPLHVLVILDPRGEFDPLAKF